MKKFFTTIKNIFSIEDLRIRILNTIGFLIIFRLGSYVVLPGIDPVILEQVGEPGGQAEASIEDEARVTLTSATSSEGEDGSEEPTPSAPGDQE